MISRSAKGAESMVTKKRNPLGYAFLLWIGRLSGLDPRHVFVEELLDLDGAVAAEGIGTEGYAEDEVVDRLPGPE